ncbi:MAG: thymidine phosphorylase family protein [Candidatus Gracilibacteria bacterium]|jgi:putative thymidine phosphorylase
MQLIPNKIPIKVGTKYICILNEKTAHMLDLHASDRIYIKNGTKGNVNAILDITEDNKEIKDNEIGLYIETWEKLKTKRGDRVNVKIAEKPESILFIKDKLDGKVLNAQQINAIIKDVVEDDLTDVEISYFVAGCYTNGLSIKETVDLTKAIVNNGGRLHFNKKIVLDKHCIGGVPGNRTTLIVVPIITALGLTMPKTSSRAITSPSGTADTMEVLANVTNERNKLQKIAEKINGFITWGGGVDLAAADDRMIRARHPLSLDPQGMLLASIMAKKNSVSATHVLIDIPIGKQVKVKDKKAAESLGEKFKTIGKLLGMKVEILISNGDQPIGFGIGPVLEAMDVMKVLKNEKNAPQDLRAKALKMASILLELCGKAKKGQGLKMAEDTLKSGKAYDQLMRIIKEQGPTNRKLRPGKFSKAVLATKNGTVKEIDNKLIAHVARIAGAPKDPESGVIINKKLNDKVKKGDILYTIYADMKDRLNYVDDIGLDKVYTIK